MTTKATDRDQTLRTHVKGVLLGGGAHGTFEEVLGALPKNLRGRRPEGLAHSPWELLEHIRIAQKDILEFTRDPNWETPSWPDGFWPADPAPPDDEAWQQSVDETLEDRQALIDMATHPDVGLLAEIPHGRGQTYLRELLLAADHNAYHLGQFAAAAAALTRQSE